jgi:hypothetical protein
VSAPPTLVLPTASSSLLVKPVIFLPFTRGDPSAPLAITRPAGPWHTADMILPADTAADAAACVRVPEHGSLASTGDIRSSRCQQTRPKQLLQRQQKQKQQQQQQQHPPLPQHTALTWCCCLGQDAPEKSNMPDPTPSPSVTRECTPLTHPPPPPPPPPSCPNTRSPHLLLLPW